jgi:hypothetical protein
LATEQHQHRGHMGRDVIKIALMDRITSPDLDLSILNAIKACPQCKIFGPQQLNALLQLITCCHPFELMVGDYLSMPAGKGGYHTIMLYLDTFSQHIWAFKHKTAGMAKTTMDALNTISKMFITPEAFMSDSGSHFNNNAVQEFCDNSGCKHHITPAYSPWVNGLIEGTNKILLHVLKQLCAPITDDQGSGGDSKKLLRAWPDHLDEAVNALNHCILPALKFSPKELLLRIAVNTCKTGPDTAQMESNTQDTAIHMAYVEQQHIDGYKAAVKHAIAWKCAFNKCVWKNSSEVTFKEGQLIQVYHSNLDYTFKMERKVTPKWSQPYRVTKRIQNAYRLTQLNGAPIKGEFSTRRLRAFIPKPGSPLEQVQQQWEEENPEVDESEWESDSEDNHKS